MKKRLIIIALMLGAGFNSCTEYLDVSENSGMTEEEIYTSYTNMMKLYNAVHFGDKKLSGGGVDMQNADIANTYAFNMNASTRSFAMEATTDMYAINKTGVMANFVKGSFGTTNAVDLYAFTSNTSSNNFKPVFKGVTNSIRTLNRVLLHADEITDAISQTDVENLKGESHFFRAYAHFAIGRMYGPLPYITDLMTAENWDRKRLSAKDFFTQIANDCDTARLIFEGIDRMRRDPGPDQAGHLAASRQEYPAGVAALALKSRALLYLASPLYNPDNNNQYWIDAATAAGEALNEALKNEYSLTPMENYSDNFYHYSTWYTNEHIWSMPYMKGWAPRNLSKGQYGMVLGNAMSTRNGSGYAPTQSNVDMYDTAQGMPLETEAEREAATKAGQYDENNPYVNRDPRLHNNVYYNQTDMDWKADLCQPEADGSKEPENLFNAYYTVNDKGARTYSTFVKGFAGEPGHSNTGYLARKRTGNYSVSNTDMPNTREVIFRLAELYLNYAEAVNEAYGPTGKASNSTLTALDALNAIRGRVSADMVLKADDATVATKETFRKRVQKERNVELDQEDNHHYYDIRRWKTAAQVMSAPRYGMMIKKNPGVPADAPYEQRFTHTRVEVSSAYQGTWFDYMNFWPFQTDDYFKYKVMDLSLNPYW